MNESRPYAFAFDTKSKPGVIICDCVRFETVELPVANKDDVIATFGYDINRDPRQAKFMETVKSVLAQ